MLKEDSLKIGFFMEDQNMLKVKRSFNILEEERWCNVVESNVWM